MSSSTEIDDLVRRSSSKFHVLPKLHPIPND
jgi:hypothetical protein